ncbi:NAD(P)-dependent dehydrogenase, short-chain alcohol dehydrogenase family [Paramicrobacterium humi]|uniref:NAD(P)-dependent dehydrogenase, short-chain alcohol dehydrogenase family n=1 Tax=Paramicrobacterium humi TaxID=640635 RepID=A0A1H4KTE4_9MICO|nr:SDR family oxidoreductase [Microbacterium humi]SEB61673.1 NAD(P)-dependent dehydrogenase, short-chain alcohol dehydrogenase family [Microbacterium humi]
MGNALVTGASRGIGRATAIALSRRGDRVAVHYGSDRPSAEQTLALLEGDGHVLVGGDLSDAETARAVVDEARAGLGALDILVNNAAVAPSAATFHRVDKTDYESWQRAWKLMVDVDLTAAANVTYLFATALIDAGLPGTIVNTGSRGANRGEPDFPAYGAAKAGLHAFGQSMAVALAPHGIAVATVSPGFVGTERQEPTLTSATGDAVRAQSPFGRVGTSEEVAAAVVYLTSPEAQWASGAVLDLNGASYLR